MIWELAAHTRPYEWYQPRNVQPGPLNPINQPYAPPPHQTVVVQSMALRTMAMVYYEDSNVRGMVRSMAYALHSMHVHMYTEIHITILFPDLPVYVPVAPQGHPVCVQYFISCGSFIV